MIVGLSVGLIVMAFNNPTGNPPTGGGVIGVGSGAAANSLYIASSGNVGIGTTGPNYKLDVNGDVNVAAGSNFKVNGTALPQYSDSRVKVLTFSRDMTAASGDVSYTGFGFKPKAIWIIAIVSYAVGEMSIGFTDETYMGGVADYQNSVANSWADSHGVTTQTSLIQLWETFNPQKVQTAIFKSFDTDGFTLTWNKTGTTSAGTAYINVFAYR